MELEKKLSIFFQASSKSYRVVLILLPITLLPFWNDISGLVLCSLSSFLIVVWAAILLANCFYYMIINAQWFLLMLGLVHLSFALASFVLVAAHNITTTNVFLFQVSCVHALVFGAAFMQSVRYNVCTCPIHVPFHTMTTTATE